MNSNFHAALKLHQYLFEKHWDGSALIGPDPGIRWNYRVGRFLKSYLSFIDWKDNLSYLQAQGYWTIANWVLFEKTNENQYRELALNCSKNILRQQKEDGAWDYPNPEWKGRIATNEGTWAALGLLKSYRDTSDSTFLNGLLRWHKFLIETIGFQKKDDELAINYFANLGNTRVPNNSITVLRFLAELSLVTKNNEFMEPCAGLINFVQKSQKASGEIPYAVENQSMVYRRSHFQCYQYNAFECLNLMRYYEITKNATVLKVIEKQVSFLKNGLSDNGFVFYDCHNHYRTVTYHTTVMAAALFKAYQTGIIKDKKLANSAYNYVLGLQKNDCGFIHSQRDYYFLTDKRSYPRYQAMILLHLLLSSNDEQTT